MSFSRSLTLFPLPGQIIIKNMYMEGNATKDDYAKALQVYQEYVNEIKSAQRDEAAAFDEYYKYY